MSVHECVCVCASASMCMCLKQKDKKFTTITFLVHSIKMGFVRLERGGRGRKSSPRWVFLLASKFNDAGMNKKIPTIVTRSR